MIDRSWAREFAAEWIAAWNAHDLERILSHYSDDFEMHSPLIIERMGVANGALKGKAPARPYWQRGLAAQPPLHFEPRDVLVGVDRMAIYYRNVMLRIAEGAILRETAVPAGLDAEETHRCSESSTAASTAQLGKCWVA